MARLFEHGRYALYEALGSGAAASVHLGASRGRDSIGREQVLPVAVKRLHEGRAREPAAVARLFDEVRLSRRIVHPNVVRVIDFVSDGEVVMAVMDYVHGEPLSRLLQDTRKRNVSVPVPIAASIVRDVLLGLQAAHEAKDSDGTPLGIVHRDATPENVLVGADGISRITDFGVAKADGRMLATQDGGVRGKIAYLAPEQVGGDVSAVTDVFAIGLMLWELLAGERPMQGGTEAELLVQVMNGQVPNIREKVPTISASLDITIARATAKEPERRFSSAAAFAEGLERSVERLASPSEVAAWVRELAGDRLARREQQVGEMIALEMRNMPSESHPSLLVPVATGLSLPPPAPMPVPQLMYSTPPGELGLGYSSTDHAFMRPPPSRTRPYVLMAAAAMIVGIGVFWLASTLPHGPVVVAAPSDPDVVLDAGPPPQQPQPAPAPSPSQVDPQPAPQPIPAPAPSPGPRRGPRHPSVNCDPPYTIDAQGIRRYKVECMH